MYVLSTCTLLVLYVYSTCTLLVLYLYSTCTLRVLYLYSTCTLLVLYVYFTCTLPVLYLYSTCTLLVLYLYSTCTLLVLCILAYCQGVTKRLLWHGSRISTVFTLEPRDPLPAPAESYSEVGFPPPRYPLLPTPHLLLNLLRGFPTPSLPTAHCLPFPTS